MSGARTPEEIEADIVAQRESLAQTVDELSARLDVKSQAQAKAAELKASATTDTGNPRPELLAAAGGVVLLCVVALVLRRRRAR